MDRPPARARSRTARIVRYTVLGAVLVLSTGLGLLHAGKNETFLPAGVDALCPFGGVETLWALLASDTLLQRIALSSVVLLVATVGIALLFGRAFCGQVCPLGTLQELVGRLGARLGVTQTKLPAGTDRPARFLKYAVLAVATVGTWAAGTLVFRTFDPWAAYHHLTSAELLTDFGVGAIVLGAALGGSLFYQRSFCRYACPMGALLGLLSRFSWVKIHRDEEACSDCGRCDRTCQLGLDVSTADVMDSSECIACGECVSACGHASALAFVDRRGAAVTPTVITLATVALFFGVIGVSTATETFEWTKPTLGSQMREVRENPSAFDASVIKGYMTLAEVAQQTGIPPEQLQRDFAVPVSGMELQLKEAKDAYGFTMNDIRAYVALYLGAPAPEHEDH